MWAVQTPQAIFPERRIGRLDEGYEASFLVLNGNPVEDWSAMRRIRLRVKRGNVLP
jgi:imidazolonepropionase-like amidohydrolase